MKTYICITDEGRVSQSGGCSETNDNIELPKKHLIRIEEYLTDADIDDLLRSFAKTRKNPQIIGGWLEDDVLNYSDIAKEHGLYTNA